MTTGFSGTNDDRALLPLCIAQRDLPDLLHTNAAVLSCLLEPRNQEYVQAADADGHRLSVDGLLDTIIAHKSPGRPGISIILDAGAQVLEMENREFVGLWLSKMTDAKAGIFVSRKDEIMVLSRDGRDEKLSSSSFADNRAGCLVYLDEAHCRGIDLKLEATARAAVTLSPKQTKDQTAQGMHYKILSGVIRH